MISLQLIAMLTVRPFDTEVRLKMSSVEQERVTDATDLQQIALEQMLRFVEL